MRVLDWYDADVIVAAPSGPPLNVTLTIESSSVLVVSWQAPLPWLQNGNVVGYDVQYAVQSNSNQGGSADCGVYQASFEHVSVDGTTTMLSVPGYSAQYGYVVSVAGMTSGGIGVYCGCVNVSANATASSSSSSSSTIVIGASVGAAVSVLFISIVVILGFAHRRGKRHLRSQRGFMTDMDIYDSRTDDGISLFSFF